MSVKIEYKNTYGDYVSELYNLIKTEKEKEHFIQGVESAYQSLAELEVVNGKEPPPRTIISELMRQSDDVLEETSVAAVKYFENMKMGGEK